MNEEQFKALMMEFTRHNELLEEIRDSLQDLAGSIREWTEHNWEVASQLSNE